MAADILWADIVGNSTIDNGGKVGDLMALSFAYIAKEMDNNRITQAEAGQIYTAMIPAAFQNAMQFVMNEKLTEANIDKALSDARIAQQQADREYVLTLATVDKAYGYSYTLDSEGAIIKTSLVDTGDGKMDYENTLVDAQISKIVFDKKAAVIGMQLSSMVDLYKNKQLDGLTEIISTQTEVERLYNTVLADLEEDPSTIVPGN